MQMAPSTVEWTEKLSCCVCEESTETVSSLHYHQMCYHTTEELSLALLNLKGLELLTGDLHGIPENEDDVLCAGLTKYPHFLVNEDKIIMETDSESTDTAESSKLQGAISTLDGENIAVPVVRISPQFNLRGSSKRSKISNDTSDDMTPLRSESRYRTKLAVKMENVKSSSKYTDLDQRVRRNECDRGHVEEEVENLILTCQSDDSKNKCSSDTDTDVETKLNDSNGKIYESEDEFCSIFIKSESEISEPVIENIETQDAAYDVETKTEKLETCCSSPSSLDSVLSPDNSPRPDRYIKAIISRLPNIVAADGGSQGRRTSRKKLRTPRRYINDSYVLPSPISQHHRSTVSYTYEGKQGSNCQEREPFQDFFVPNIKFEGCVDAESSTNHVDISEKEVQTATTNPSDDDSGIQMDVQENRGKRQSEEAVSKETQTGVIGITTQQLAAFRKPVTKKERELDRSFGEIQFRAQHQLNGVYNLGTKMDGKSLMKIYPRGTTDRRFFCAPCGRGYKKKSHLERHIRVHTGERPFQCPHCEKSFAVRSILKQHERTHTGEKPYCCSVCQQRFPQKSGLMTHMMLHTGKPFKCDYCEKAFVSNHKLLQHMKSHGGPRKHVCETCGTEFFTEGAMRQHQQVHINSSAHLCMICGKNFQHEVLLKVHLEQHFQRFGSIDPPA